MANKMLIDATHPEETRVVVLRGNRVEEFDFESANRKQLRGNIYLAKVTRVEPSLQAAFVDYGGNRHGFLAFSEIHPDYYQIPVADRQALIAAEERDASATPTTTPTTAPAAAAAATVTAVPLRSAARPDAHRADRQARSSRSEAFGESTEFAGEASAEHAGANAALSAVPPEPPTEHREPALGGAAHDCDWLGGAASRQPPKLAARRSRRHRCRAAAKRVRRSRRDRPIDRAADADDRPPTTAQRCRRRPKPKNGNRR